MQVDKQTQDSNINYPNATTQSENYSVAWSPLHELHPWYTPNSVKLDFPALLGHWSLSPWHSLLYNAPNCVLMFSCCWFPNYSATISSRTSCLGDLKASASSGGITYGCEMKKKIYIYISFHAFGRCLYIHHGNLAQVLKHFKFSSILQQPSRPKLLPAYKYIAPHPTCSQRSSPHFLIKYD